MNDYTPISVNTSASEKNTGVNLAFTIKKAVIVDAVAYEGLLPGREYTIKGVLMDKETRKPLLINGKEVTAEKTFTAKATSGVEELEFELDARELVGKQVVVFEKLYSGIRLAGSHEDIHDGSQTIIFMDPEVRTTAQDSETGTNQGFAIEKSTIIDKVEYTNLIAGKEYTVKGLLMSKETGEKLLINGKEVTAKRSFVAETSNGSIDIEFHLDASSLAGQSVVVFEDLYFNGYKIASHADIEDEGQTIEYPDSKIRTKASDKADGDENILAGEKAVIVDAVTYSGLIPRKEYTIKGILMDKKTNKSLLINGKEIVSEKTFTPDQADGVVELEFSFDGRGLAGREIVVFEKLFYGDFEVTNHEDINDEGQTVKMLRLPVGQKSNAPKTGDTSSVLILVAGLIISLGTIVAIVVKRRRRGKLIKSSKA